MTFYSAFQWNAFQWNAYQIARNGTPEPTGGSGEEGREAYVSSYDRLLLQQAKVKKVKTDLERLDSVLGETERKKALAAQSAALARQKESLKRAIELEALEAEFLKEINRLLMVRAALIRRVKEEEGILIIMIMARKRRLRLSIQPAGANRLH